MSQLPLFQLPTSPLAHRADPPTSKAAARAPRTANRTGEASLALIFPVRASRRKACLKISTPPNAKASAASSRPPASPIRRAE